jgi:hypothetical protein
MSRPSPTSSPTTSDDEGEDEICSGETEQAMEDNNPLDVMDCIDGLMELATQTGGGGGDDTIQTCEI